VTKIRLHLLLSVSVGILFLLVFLGCGGGSQQAANMTATHAVKIAKKTLTPAQRRERQARERTAVAKAKVAAKARARARARAAKKAAAAAARAAAAHAAYVAAANAWHKGYYQQDDNVYWEWRHNRSCQDYATSGCWHVAVITRGGCQSYVAVNANEYQGGAIIGQLLDNQDYGIPPKTVRVFELDADANGVTANNLTIDCN
jgi:hypothetical protein